MRILLVEDNRRLNGLLKRELTEAGYAVDVAFDGIAGQELAETTPFDAIVLDVMVPGKDGFAVCRALRTSGTNTPIVMLTARDSVSDRVRGLDSGADDYLVKPFAMAELLARLRALFRREAPSRTGLLQVGDLVLDPATRYVERAGRPIILTSKSYALLEYFVRHPNQVITREMIEQHVWSYDYDGASNVVDVYVRRVRRQIDDPYEIKLLETIRGVGYRLRTPAPAVRSPDR